MSVSVLLAIYSGTCVESLEKCYLSIVRQSFEGLEVLTVWDGEISRDLELVSNMYSDAIVRLDKNLGLGKALNAGLEKCSHDLIARIDCDDLMLGNRLMEQYDYLCSNQNVDVVGGSAIQKNRLGKSILKKVPVGELQNKHFWLRNPIIHPSVMFRKSVVQGAGGYPNLRYTQDFVLWIKLQSNGVRMHNIDTPLIEFNPQGYKTRNFNEFKRVLPAYRMLYATKLVPYYKICLGLIIRMTFYFANSLLDVFRKTFRVS